MERFITAFIINLFLFTSMTTAQATETPESIFSSPDMTAVMSFNLFVGNAKGDRSWDARREQVTDIIREYRPLFLGTQEGLHRQLQDLKHDLPDYRAIGTSRRGNAEDEHAAIFYDASRATLKNHGDFWLSDTPDVPGSVMDNSGHPRMVTWGEFRTGDSPKPTFVFNTHLALEEDIALKQAQVFLKRLNGIVPKDAEILITGDFNARRGGPVWQAFADAGFADALQIADHQGGPNHTSHCWEGEEVSSQRRRLEREGHKVDMVDWIFHRGGKPNQPLLAQVVEGHRNGIYPSDHYPLVLTSLGQAKPVLREQNNPDGTTIDPDESVTQDVSMHNEGTRGIAPLTLSVDGKPATTRWSVLEAQETKAVSLSTTLHASGKHRITVEGLPPRDITVADAPARITHSELSVDPYLAPGQETIIHATTRNLGGKSGTAALALEVNGEAQNTTDITLAAGESHETEFRHRFTEEGVYHIRLGDKEQEINVARDLGADWHFAKGDDPARAEATHDDTDWQKVTLPAPWEQHSGYKEDNVFGWYRSGITIPKEWEGRPVRILLGQIDDADQTFFNGHKIGASGHMPDDREGYQSAAFAVRAYTIPPELIKYGEPNSLSIRVFDGLGDGGIAKGPLGMLPLQEKAKDKWQDSVRQERSEPRQQAQSR